MPLFTVTDSTTNAPIEGAKVVVRRSSDNAIVYNGFTNSSGQLDVAIGADLPHTLLAYKSGSYDGSRISLALRSGILLPSGVGLAKVTARKLIIKVYVGSTTPLTVGSLIVKRADGGIHYSTGLDAGGGAMVDLPADLAGWKAYLTTPGMDGVSFPLDKIDLLGTVVIVLAPTIGPDE